MTPVRVLTWLLVLTAAATAAVEALNWWLTPEGGWSLLVRTGWALLRSAGFLVLIRHVRRGRRAAAPFGLILAVTTVFGVARLVVPRSGYPALPGIAGFVLVTVLCLAVVSMLHLSPTLREHLVEPPRRPVLTRTGVAWRTDPRPPVPGRLLTARACALAYSPLMLVGALVAVGAALSGRPAVLPLVAVWFVAAIVVSYAVVFLAFFLVRGRRWARAGLVLVTLAVLGLHLTMCRVLLGWDGLVRDGGPVAVAGVLCLWGLGPAGREDARPRRQE